jgi:hypothetical protein
LADRLRSGELLSELFMRRHHRRPIPDSSNIHRKAERFVIAIL